jgi:hypothetical protein
MDSTRVSSINLRQFGRFSSRDTEWKRLFTTAIRSPLFGTLILLPMKCRILSGLVALIISLLPMLAFIANANAVADAYGCCSGMQGHCGGDPLKCCNKVLLRVETATSCTSFSFHFILDQSLGSVAVDSALVSASKSLSTPTLPSCPLDTGPAAQSILRI